MLLTPNWICGFVDGEGTFFISIEKQPKMRLKKQVRLGFKVTQSIKNVKVLYALKQFFGVGVVKIQRKNQDSKVVWEYRVSNFTHMTSKIIPFFEKNSLYTLKRFDFLRVRYVSILMLRGNHLEASGLERIEKIHEKMNNH